MGTGVRTRTGDGVQKIGKLCVHTKWMIPCQIYNTANSDTFVPGSGKLEPFVVQKTCLSNMTYLGMRSDMKSHFMPWFLLIKSLVLSTAVWSFLAGSTPHAGECRGSTRISLTATYEGWEQAYTTALAMSSGSNFFSPDVSLQVSIAWKILDSQNVEGQ
jgi:hypothetical protein